MNLRERFAAKLQSLCAGERSIAAVCRGTGINRQQFNRYLAGTSLPNQRNITRIAQYFGVDEAALFINGQPPASTNATKDDASPVALDLSEQFELISRERPSSLDPGLYYVHFGHPHDPGSIMRSLFVVRRDGNLTTFRRLTGRSERRGSWWAHFHGDHKGIILERRHWIYCVGMNRLGNHEPTLLVLRWLPSSNPILGGHATILTPIGPTITSAVLVPCPQGTTIRNAIRESHVYASDASQIDPLILDALHQQGENLIEMVQPLDLTIKEVAQP